MTLETLAITIAFVMFLDFFCGLRHLYNASATTQEDQPEEAMVAERTAFGIAVEPTRIDPDETAHLFDPWTTEVEEVIEFFPSDEIAPKRIYLLPPTVLEEASQLDTVDYSGWSIRVLKKEAQNRKLSKYSNLTKKQLISRFAAA